MCDTVVYCRFTAHILANSSTRRTLAVQPARQNEQVGVRCLQYLLGMPYCDSHGGGNVHPKIRQTGRAMSNQQR